MFLDRVPLPMRRAEVTPEGYLRADALIARTGVQTYVLADGREVGILRHPDDVFAEESLRSWAGQPVTLDHPAEGVSAQNARELARGLTGLDVEGLRRPKDRQETVPGFVKTTLVILDADAVRAASTTHPELSCGYTATIDAEEGVWGGVPFSYRQRNIRANHVALVEQGRAGPDVRPYGLADSVTIARGLTLAISDSDLEQEIPKMEKKDQSATTRTSGTAITRDGMTVELEPAAFVAVHKWLQDADACAGESSEMEDQIKGLKDQVAALTGERDAMRAELDKMKADAAAAPSADAKIGDAVNARLALLRRAEELTFGSKVTFGDCKTDREIRLKVVQTRLPDIKVADDAADAYLVGLLDGLRVPEGAQPAAEITKKDVQDSAPQTLQDARTAYKQGLAQGAQQKQQS